ncbi:hypothetical protein [Paenibacillus hexagrammi]|uniref:DUF998 domain-containing protein n=1 Tax=Paenibacillus hexagrammi TaxID=2908839 RepID=A0ABY3SCQ0_9BACL|nr:hypothetical protein [Paenibacillus sp. YPD9-1]UJF31577.1 hypothetical protein L0M14_17375 [Paenibacillus sp. YPD9-1]
MHLTLPKGFLRFSGWALFLGGILGVIGQILHAGDVPESVAAIPSFLKQAVSIHVMLAFSSTFLLMGLPGLFLRQSQGLRVWGWVGLPLLFIGMMFEIFHGPVQILAYLILFGSIHDDAALKLVSDQINNLSVDQYPLQLLVLIPILPCILIGLLLTGLSSLKARILPKGPGILALVVLALLIIGRFIPLQIFDYSFSLIHLVYIWFGATLAFESSSRTSSSSSSSSISGEQA